MGSRDVLARGIRSYHRPTRIEEAQDLAAQGAVLMAGGTRLLMRDEELPNVVDLVGLGLRGTSVDDEDLHLGALTPVQEVADSPVAHAHTAGLLPAACRAALPSRLLRGMATIGGEAIAADPDSELVAALIALNAVFLVAHPGELRESPALRFLRSPARDLEDGGILRGLLIPGAPHGAALERVAALPSLPPIVAVAVTTTLSGDKLARVRLAVTGLSGPPARVMDAEAKLERTEGEEGVLASAAAIVAEHAPFRDDAFASAPLRRRMARVLAMRALRTAIASGRSHAGAAPPRPRAAPTQRVPAPLPNFTSGRIELHLNGKPARLDAEARTTLLELLRAAGVVSARSGCGSGRCGACAVLVDGRPAASCLMLAVRAQGRSVVTLEGLGSAERPHPLQSAFAEAGAAQCGFCAPGLVLGARAMLDAVAHPSESDVRDALAGLCRCTGYARAVAGVQQLLALERP
jgi:aerobic-type carbon monoxide dehydrogenase small subunit (CoxS/CutS family)/CO/xanthine dehydrogenase FAD-binding subunit